MIGVDVISIKRFDTIKKNDFLFWNKVFTQNEWRYSFNSTASSQHLAGIFAAKEAVMKALENKKFVQRYDLIEITRSSDSKPGVSLKTKKNKKLALSISHDSGLAVAIAMAR